MTRIRRHYEFGTSGNSIVRGGWWPSETYVKEYHGVTDTPDIPGDGWGFDVIHEEWLGGKAWYPNDGWYWYNGTVCEAVKGQSGYLGAGLELPDSPGDGEAATHVMAASNPSKPYVDLPVSIAELRELPDLLHSAGSGLLRQLGSGNLKYQFGIAPLASDVAKLVYFQQAVDKRFARIKKLRDKGLRSTINVGNYSNEDYRWVSLNSFGYGWSEIIHFITTQRVWGHIRWFPNPSVLGDFPKTDDDLRRLATRATLGLTVDASTAWNLLPWSWLVDWFSNLGDYLEAHRNIVPASCSPVQVMRETRVENVGPPHVWWDGQHNDGVIYRRVMKARRLSNATLGAHLSGISARQASILGSIAVTRR